jgi:hypothetical protein
MFGTGILNTRKHNISKNGYVSGFMLGEEDNYSVPSLRKN